MCQRSRMSGSSSKNYLRRVVSRSVVGWSFLRHDLKPTCNGLYVLDLVDVAVEQDEL